MLPAHLGRAIVRHLEEEDYAAYIALERDAAVKQYVNGVSSRGDDELLAGLRRRARDVDLLAIADPINKMFIGRCGLLASKVRTELELYCLLQQGRWGRGIGEVVIPFLARLARDRGRRAIGIVHPENGRSIALLTKLSWVQRGTVSDDGKQLGHLLYAESAD
jgi:RimJ/RimL family protein N-acetyltransferase